MPSHPPVADRAPDQLLSLPAPLAARLLARQFVSQAEEAATRIGLPGPEGSAGRFKLRVALRRLRVTLDAYEPVLADTVPRKLGRKAQSLARRLGAARDQEVQAALLTELLAERTKPQRDALERSALHAPLIEAASTDEPPAPEEVTADLQSRWQKLAAPLHEALDSWHEVHRIDAPRTLLPFGEVAADALEHAGARIARRMQRVATANDRAALHAARLAIKSARYLLKPLAGTDPECTAMLDALRHAQDQLGAINDAHALLAGVERMREVPESSGAPSRVVTAGVDGLARDIGARMELAFANLAPWREPDALTSQRARLAAIADAWRSASTPPMEIERKWLLSALPPRVHGLSPALLRQGYLPGEALVERIRSVTHGDGATAWIRTVKVGRGMSRIEIEEVTTTTLGETLFALTEGKRVEKRRYAVSDGPLTWEIDDFTDRTLVLAEVELPSEATPVEPPTWLAPYIVRDVTDEAEFTNWKLAR